MKKHFQTSLILIMMILSGNAFAQTGDSPAPKVKPVVSTHLGILINLVNTNLNYGNANSELSDYKKANQGLQAGFTFQGGITSRLSVLSEFYFIMKGGQLKADNSLTTSKSSLRLYALEFPVLARVQFGRFYVNAGPYAGYNLSGRKKIEGASTSVSFEDSPDGFKRFEAGMQIGGGYKFKIKRKNVLLDLRYSNGLTSISHGQDMYNRYLNLSLQLINPWKTNPLAIK